MTDEQPASENVITALKDQFVAEQKVHRIERLRDHLDVMAREAAAMGREMDRAALDAGSFALTYVLRESQGQ